MHDNLRRLKTLTTRLNEKDQEIRQQKETYESLVELLPEIVLVHRGNEIVFINTYGLQIFGFDSKEDIVGKCVYDYIVAEDHAKIRNLLMHVNGVCRQEDFTNVQLIKNDKSIMLGEAGASTVIWKGKPATQTVIRDVTHFKRLEKRLLRLQYEKDYIDNIMITPNRSFILADGWSTKLIERDSKFDVYEVHATRGCDLNKHSHQQKEFVEIIKGEVVVFLREDTVTLKSGDTIEIPPFEPHKFTAIEDTKMKVTFTPPLSIGNN